MKNDKREKNSLQPKFNPDLIVNLSYENLSDEEFNLLNKGLRYSIKPQKTPVLESVVDIETILKFNTH